MTTTAAAGLSAPPLDGLRVLDLSRVLAGSWAAQTLADLGAEALAEADPPLIHCSISGYGRTGPRAREAGYDFAILAESRLMAITGEPAGAPIEVGAAVADLVAGMNAVQAILAALIARQRTGCGQLIDMSLFDGAVALLANVARGCIATGTLPGRFGNARATVVPCEVMPSADGTFVLAAGNDAPFAALCRDVLERPDLAGDARFATNSVRAHNRLALIGLSPADRDALRERGAVA